MTKLAVLVLHGIGNTGPGFADKMIAEVHDHLGKAADDVLFEPCFWGNVLDGRQTELANRMAPFVDKTRIRRELVIGGMGDLIAYLGMPTSPSIYYRPIHERIENSLSKLESKLRKANIDPETTPLIIMAHSLGGYLASNYLWDHQRNNDHAFARSPFSACETLVNIITFGCNLPLTSLSFPEGDTHPALPFGKLGKACFSEEGQMLYSASVKWLNFFDQDDILGFPLAPVNEAYASQVRDIDINTGGLLRAHTAYWTDNDFTHAVTKRLRELLMYLIA
jgi:pimeloyl-ACP methyl ester carboxylesterase